MEYFITLMIWIGEAKDQHAARPHCEQVFDIINTGNVNFWDVCHADKACKAIDDSHGDLLESICDQE